MCRACPGVVLRDHVTAISPGALELRDERMVLLRVVVVNVVKGVLVKLL